jgi:hypothetical protein
VYEWGDFYPGKINIPESVWGINAMKFFGRFFAE